MTLQKSLTPDLLKLLPSADEGAQVWLVGGAVRDHFLNRSSPDLDFVVSGDALRLARRIADRLGAKYYTLDLERGAGRVLVSGPGDTERILDFTRMRGADLQEDLGLRDFTINAMALAPHRVDELIDPEGGLMDLKEARLRACRSDSVLQDPVRALRAVRIASELDLRIEPDTIEQIKGSRTMLNEVSVERLRDELFRMLGSQQPAQPLRLLEHLRLLELLLQVYFHQVPEASPNGANHDSIDQALTVISRVSDLFQILGPVHDPEAAADSTLGIAAIRLGRYRQPLSDYLDLNLSSGRTRKAWVILGSFFSTGVNQTIADAGGGLGDDPNRESKRAAAEAWSEHYHLSRREIVWLERFIQGKVPLLPATPGGERDLQIFRYFQRTQDAGPGLCFSDLGNFLASRDSLPSDEKWERKVSNASYLLEAYFLRKEEVIDLEPLLSGEELISTYDLQPGPMIGELLQSLVEYQVEEKIQTHAQALDYVGGKLAGRDRHGQE